MSSLSKRADDNTIEQLLANSLSKSEKFESGKQIRCKKFKENSDIPTAFKCNTNKEQLLIERVKKYETCFKDYYDNRNLFLYPLNEVGVEKFICSTIRPTKSGYVELSEFRRCAQFVSDFVNYEPIEDVDKLPLNLVSPFNTLKWQAGDSADIAIALASLLLGASYDAFVVMGQVHIDIIKKNECSVPFDDFLGAEFFNDNDSPEDLKDNVKGDSSKLDSELKKLKTLNSQASLTDNSKFLKSKFTQNGDKTNKERIGGDFAGNGSKNNDTKLDFISMKENGAIAGKIFKKNTLEKDEGKNEFYVAPFQNKDRDYHEYIFGESVKQENTENCNIFYKENGKYDLKSDFEQKFKQFLVDDEILKMKSIQSKIENIETTQQGSLGNLDKKATVESSSALKNDSSKLRQAQIVNNEQPTEGLHFWILLRPSSERSVESTIFIDPISGRYWNVSDPNIPFISIKQIFNHVNVWINLDENLPISKINFSNFDDYQNEFFEYVLRPNNNPENSMEFREEHEDIDNSQVYEKNLEARMNAESDTLQKISILKNPNFTTLSGLKSSMYAQDDDLININKEISMFANENAKKNKGKKPDHKRFKNFADRIFSMNNFSQKPISWVPKLEIDAKKFFEKFSIGHKRKFFKKCQIDFYSQFSQHDGIVQKNQLFLDHKCLHLKEVRSYYKNRLDRLHLKRDFPFQFRSIEYYDICNSNGGNNNNPEPQWREIESFQGTKIIIRFHPLRFHDGLIERSEIIGQKVIEKYQNRDDRLVYLSSSFVVDDSNGLHKDNYCYEDRHLGSVKIKKMVQKFSLNSLLPAQEQISKVIFDLHRNVVRIFYHMESTQIYPKICEISRDTFVGPFINSELQNTGSTQTALRPQFLLALEKDCFSKIKTSENKTINDFKNFRNMTSDDGKWKIDRNSLATQLVSPKSKFPLNKNGGLSIGKSLGENNKENVKDMNTLDDPVEFALRKRGLVGQKLDRKICEQIKEEILAEIQDRYIQRADIINKRFEEEKSKAKNMHRKLQKKTLENNLTEEEDNFEEELYQFNLKLDILEQRLFNFQKTAFEKYEEMQHRLNSDVRLKN